MQIVKDTPFEFAYLVSQVRPPRPSLTVIVKGTFKLVAGSAALVADTQAPCHDDVHHEDDETLSVRMDTDFAVLKPRGECFVAGTCHAPGGRPTEVSGIAFKIGSVSKMLAVFGDRFWNSKLLWKSLTRPVPFTTMPLRYERSFGGADSEANPHGIGLGEVATADGPVRPVPNIEDPKTLIRTPGDRPAPAGCFPIGRLRKSRVAKTGTYDEAWRASRWPWFPADFDYAYFNAAPADQQIEGYWHGDEEIVLRNMTASRELFSTRLAGVRARCFLEAKDRGWREIAMHLDTISIDADAGTAYCVWRGVTEVSSEKLDEIARLYLTHEPLDQRATAPAQRARMELKIEAQRREDDGFAPETPPALPTPPAVPSVALPAAGAVSSAMPGVTPGLDPDAPAAVDLRAEVTAGLSRGESFEGRDLTGANLGDLDLTGANFSATILTGARLNGARLERACLDGASLASANLSGAYLRGASLKSADLTGVIGPGADFEGATLDNAVFVQARLSGALFKTASCIRTEFGEAELVDADFREAKLDRADFAHAKLDGADFTAASLVDATVEAVSALRVNMDRCDLTKLRGSEGARFTGSSFRRAKAPGSRWGTSNLDRADFTEAILDGADFSNASLSDALMNGCRLKRTRFQEADLTRVSMLRADAFEGMFEAANLTDADLRGANLFGAEFWRARTEGTRLDTAILTRTKLA